MWKPIGPAPQEDRNSDLTPYEQPVTGRASVLAQAGGTILIGAAGGGVWLDDKIIQAFSAELNNWTWPAVAAAAVAGELFFLAPRR